MAARPKKKFTTELRVKPLPAEAEEYCKQYLINLTLQGFVLVSPSGHSINKDNLVETLRKWHEAK